MHAAASPSPAVLSTAYPWKRASNLDQLLHRAEGQQSPAKADGPAAPAAARGPPPTQPLQVSQTTNRAAPMPAATASAAAHASVQQLWKPAVAAQPHAPTAAAAAVPAAASPMRAAAGFMAGRTNATAAAPQTAPPQTVAPRPQLAPQTTNVFQPGAVFVPPWKQQMQAQQAQAAARAASQPQQQQQQQPLQLQPTPANIWARPAGTSAAAPMQHQPLAPGSSVAPPPAATGLMSAPPRAAPAAPTSAGRPIGPPAQQLMRPAAAAAGVTGPAPAAPFNRALGPAFAQQQPPASTAVAPFSAASNPWARHPSAAPFSQASAHPPASAAGAPAAASTSSSAIFNSRTYQNGNRTVGGAAPAAAAGASIWNRPATQPFGPQRPPQQQQPSSSQQPATFASTGNFSWSGSVDSFAESKAANAEFMSRFRPSAAAGTAAAAAGASPHKGPGGVAAAAVAPGSGPGFSQSSAAASSVPTLTPLCHGHNLPMTSAVSRKPDSMGKRFFSCPLSLSAPKDKCKSWVWESALHAPRSGYKFAQRGSDGQLMQEIVLSLEVMSEDRFSLAIVPPCVELSEKLMSAEMISELGTAVDQQALAALPPYAKIHPTLFTFPLSKYDALVRMLKAPRPPGASSHWIVASIPDQARKALMEDLMLREAQEAAAAAAVAGGEPEQETEMAEQICENMATSGAAAAAAASSSSAAVVAAAASSDSMVDELAASNSKTKKKKGGSLLVPKKQAMDAARKKEMGLTPEEEGCLNLEKLPSVLRTALLAFQLEGVRYIISKRGRALLSDEMGLGKTLQGISVAAYYHRDWPLLVICPSSLRLNWQDEIVKWMPFLSRSRISVIMSKKQGEKELEADNKESGVFIISYDLAASLGAELKKRKFQCVIVDESHCIKSKSAKRTKMILPLLKQAKRAILLTGTPALNRPEELYTQISALQPKLFPSYNDFGLRYCAGSKSAFGSGMDFKGSSHLKELHVLLKKYLLIRREKADVLKELPVKRRQAIYCEIPKGKCSAGLRASLKEVNEEHGSLDAAVNNSLSSRKPSSAMMKLWQLTGDAKLPQVQDYMSELLEIENLKFLVFAHHQSVLNALETFVRNHPKLPGYMRIDGSTPAEKRQENVHNFQADADCRVALLSITAAGTGITLHSASHVLFAELIWTPAYLVQAEDRVHRIGQHHPVNVQYILGRNTLDDHMWPMISQKLECIGRAVSGDALHLEMDETKEAPTDRDQRRLDSFLSPQGDNEDEALADVVDLIRAQQQEQAEAEKDEEDENLFLLSPPDSASASSSRKAKKAKVKSEKPRAKRRKTDSPSAPPAVAASSSAAAAAAAAVQSDDDSICDLTTSSALTPQTNRSLPTSASNSATSNGGASGRTTLAAPASAVRSPTRAAGSTALSKTSPPSASSRVADAASSMAIDAVDLSAEDATADSIPQPSSGSRRRKRIAALSDDEDADAEEDADSDGGDSHLFPTLHTDDDDDDFLPPDRDPLHNPTLQPKRTPKPQPKGNLLRTRSPKTNPGVDEPHATEASAEDQQPAPDTDANEDVIPPSPEPEQEKSPEAEWELLSAQPHKADHPSSSKALSTPSASQQSHAKAAPAAVADDLDDDWLE